jgi:hypothetical protein
MSDIIVTLPDGDLWHLREKILARKNSEIAFWNMKRYPKSLEAGNKVFIACGGSIHGYFEVVDIRKKVEGTTIGSYERYYEEKLGEMPQGVKIQIIFGDWHYIKEIHYKGFPGFRYADFPYELDDDNGRTGFTNA